MTDYTPFQEPQSDDVRVLTRQTWDELRRISVAVGELSANDAGGGDTNGSYAIGFTDDAFWNPAVGTPTAATRIPMETHSVAMNIITAPFELTILAAGDYSVDVRLQFEASAQNDVWNLAVFLDGLQVDNALQFNSRDYPEQYLTWMVGFNAPQNGVVDVRLWPASAPDTGTIRQYTYSLVGVAVEPPDPLPGSDLEQRVTDLENQMAVIAPLVQAHETEINALQTDVAAIQAEQIIQNGRLDAIEAEQITQNGRLDSLEYNQGEIIDALNWLADGTHAHGRVDARYRHAPANNGNNTNTRLTFDVTDALSNVTQVSNYGFTPQYEGDYHILVTIRFAPDSSGDEWRIQGYQNGSALGDTFEFKPDEVSGGTQVLFTFQAAGYFNVGDVIDVRLWPKDSGKGGWLEDYSYQFEGLGLIDPDWQPV